MKKYLALLCVALPGFAALVNMPASPTPTTPTTPPNKPKEIHAPIQSPIPSRPRLIIPPSGRTSKPDITQTGDWFHFPGAVAARDGRWAGADNLLNISKSIPIQVNFIEAEHVEVAFTAEKLQTAIAEIFEKGGISPVSNASPPLPFFNLVVLIFPTANGLAAACQGRLFEKVNLERVHFREEIFQAITWEQTNLVFGPTADFERMLTATVQAIANNFVNRLNAQAAPTRPSQREGPNLPR